MVLRRLMRRRDLLLPLLACACLVAVAIGTGNAVMAVVFSVTAIVGALLAARSPGQKVTSWRRSLSLATQDLLRLEKIDPSRPLLGMVGSGKYKDHYINVVLGSEPESWSYIVASRLWPRRVITSGYDLNETDIKGLSEQWRITYLPQGGYSDHVWLRNFGSLV